MTDDTRPDETLNPKHQKQLDLEKEMRSLGSERFWKAIEKARCNTTKGGNPKATLESETGYGAGLLAWAVVPVSEGVKAFMEEANSGKAGRRHAAVAYLDLLEPDVAAYIACRVIIDGITQRLRLQNIAVQIGSMVEDEVRFQAFEAGEGINPRTGQMGKLKKLFQKITKGLEAEGASYDHKRTVLVHSAGKAGLQWVDWPKTEKLHLGIKLVELVIERTQMVQQYHATNRKKTEMYLEVTDVFRERIKNKCLRDEVLCPVYQPMVVPPVDWSSPTGGGYLSGRPLQFVKCRKKEFHEELAEVDLTLCYNAVNGLQKTAWKVNQKVFGVLTETWKQTHHTIGELPSRERMELPPKPQDIDTNEEARKVWRRLASGVHKLDRKRTSKWLQVEKILQVAEKFKAEPEVYFPYTVDFRGRVYATPLFLNPQGHDVAKGLLTFAHGKPLGDQRAADWLAIAGANLYGFDKVSLEERVEWVRKNQADILASAQAPLDHLWWAEADKPWQFLGFCFEWLGYMEKGLAFESCLPIALDGSCNGLQHFSAMLRDPVGGAAVNLTPSAKPHDIYQTVADRLIEKLKASKDPWAIIWLSFGINRKLTKRPVMVVPYGGTRTSARDYILAHVKEVLGGIKGTTVDGKISSRRECQEIADSSLGHENYHMFGSEKDLFLACNFLSGLVWEAISETVVAARDAMMWLQKVSRIVSREEKPLNWTAPTGFKVQQAYPETSTKEVRTQIAGSVIKLNLTEDLNTLNKRRQAQGISPNFVHSLDAAALMFTVDACLACGLDSFGMVHDSYATVAADTDTLRECLRQSFCQMYQMDVLKAFRDEIQEGLPDGVELPPLPTKGTLDINLVLESDFFFA